MLVGKWNMQERGGSGDQAEAREKSGNEKTSVNWRVCESGFQKTHFIVKLQRWYQHRFSLTEVNARVIMIR